MARPIRVLFGTETGNAEGCADELREAIAALGLPVELTDMDDYDRDELPEEDLVFIVTSTFGNGDPPYNAFEMMEFVKSPDAPSLEGVRFSVCALGDRSYPSFAQCGKDFDARFHALGAERIVPRTDCDVDYEVPFDQWKQRIVGWLRENHEGVGAAPAGGTTQQKPAQKAGFFSRMKGWFGGKKDGSADVAAETRPPAEAPAPVGQGEPLSAHQLHDDARAGWSKDKPFVGKLIARKRLNGEGSAKETYHYALDLTGSGIKYRAGDSFGVLPTNDPEEVSLLLDALGMDGETPVRVKDGRTLAIRSVLIRRACLQTIRMDLLRKVAEAGGPGKDALDAGPDATTAYLHDRFVLDLVREHPDAVLTADDLVALLRPIAPRLYSVASSPLTHPNEVHLLAETLRYERLGRPCVGVATTWLADRVELGGDVPLYLVPNDAFRLPEPDVDVIMVGPGTGLAPYRAFLQERESADASGRDWLFFGHQHEASDYLYRDEIEAWLQSGRLARATFAWSRDQVEKIYVQQRILEEGAELWVWLGRGAHLYVCGDAHGMAPAVEDALRKVAMQHGDQDEAGASAWLDALSATGRYHKDVY